MYTDFLLCSLGTVKRLKKAKQADVARPNTVAEAASQAAARVAPKGAAKPTGQGSQDGRGLQGHTGVSNHGQVLLPIICLAIQQHIHSRTLDSAQLSVTELHSTLRTYHSGC